MFLSFVIELFNLAAISTMTTLKTRFTVHVV